MKPRVQHLRVKAAKRRLSGRLFDDKKLLGIEVRR